MKSRIVIPILLAVFIAGVYVVPRLCGQRPEATVVKAPKIAIVNCRAVIEKDGRREKFRAALVQSNATWKAKVDKLQEEMYGSFRANGWAGSSFRFYDEAAHKKEIELEDLYCELEKSSGKHYEDLMTALHREIISAVNKNAVDYDIVLGCSDPSERELLWQYPNIARNKKAMDDGGMVPMYIHGSIDITPAVIATLASWRDKGAKAKKSPADQ